MDIASENFLKNTVIPWFKKVRPSLEEDLKKMVEDSNTTPATASMENLDKRIMRLENTIAEMTAAPDKKPEAKSKRSHKKKSKK